MCINLFSSGVISSVWRLFIYADKLAQTIYITACTSARCSWDEGMRSTARKEELYVDLQVAIRGPTSTNDLQSKVLDTICPVRKSLNNMRSRAPASQPIWSGGSALM